MPTLKNKKQTLIVLALIVSATLVSISLSYSQSIDDEAREISYLLMCPVCEGQSVAESNSELANDMRSVIRQKLEAGEDRKSTRLNSSHMSESRMPSSA